MRKNNAIDNSSSNKTEVDDLLKEQSDFRTFLIHNTSDDIQNIIEIIENMLEKKSEPIEIINSSSGTSYAN